MRNYRVLSNLILIDGGAGISLTGHREWLHDFVPITKSDNIQSIAYDHSTRNLEGLGKLIFNYTGNLLSIDAYYYEGAPTILSEDDINKCPECSTQIYHHDFGTTSQSYSKVLNVGEECIQLIQIDKLWYIPGDYNQYIVGGGQMAVNNLHLKLGHANPKLIRDSISHGTISVSKKEKDELKHTVENGCARCLRAKARRADAVEYSRDYYLRPVPFDMVYTDVCVVNLHAKKGDQGYFVTFKDQYTKFTTVYFLAHKNDVTAAVSKYLDWVENQFSEQGYRVHKLYSDKGTEYLNAAMKTLLERKGVEHHTTSGYMSASNGVAERLNLTIMNDTRAMLQAGKVPNAFWKEAASYSIFIRNHLYQSSIDTSPVMALGVKAPLKAKDIHVFGEYCVVTQPPDYLPKLHTRGNEGIYLGFDPNTFGSHVFIPNTPGDLRFGNHVYSRSVSFLKTPMLYVNYCLDHRTLNDDPLMELYDPRFQIFADLEPEEAPLSSDDAASLVDERVENEVPLTFTVKRGSRTTSSTDLPANYNDELIDAHPGEHIPEANALNTPFLVDEEIEAEPSQFSNDDIVIDTSTGVSQPFPESTDYQEKVSTDESDDPDWTPDANMQSSSEPEDYSDDDSHELSDEEPQTHQVPDKNKYAEDTSLFDLDPGNHSTSKIHYRKLSPDVKVEAKYPGKPLVSQNAGKAKSSKRARKGRESTQSGQSNRSNDSPTKGGNATAKGGADFKPTVVSTAKESQGSSHTLNPSDSFGKHANVEVSGTRKIDAWTEDSQKLKKQGPEMARAKQQTHTEHPIAHTITSDEGSAGSQLLPDSLVTQAEHGNKPLQDYPHPPSIESGKASRETSSSVAGKKSEVTSSIVSSLPSWKDRTMRSLNRPTSRKRQFQDEGDQDRYDYTVPPINTGRTGPKAKGRWRYAVKHKKFKVTQVLLSDVHLAVTPNNYKEAICSKDGAAKWKTAIADEFRSHQIHNTWDPTPIVTNDPRVLSRTVSTRWVFNIKSDGRYKARLVARGDHQKESTYTLTFSPTLRPEIMRSILALIATKHWFMAQFDIKTAYLNSSIDTELYIYQPQGYYSSVRHSDVANGKRVVYRLNKALYGLKQSGKLWHETIKAYLAKIGFEYSNPFPSTYIHKNAKGKTDCVVGLFVDDIIIGALTESILAKVTKHLRKAYELKTIEQDPKTKVQRFLGIDLKVERFDNGRVGRISLCQSSYIEEFVEKLKIETTRKCATPLSPNFYFDSSQHPLKLSQQELDERVTDYRRKIGCLLYVSTMTRPDIAYAVDYLARFSTYPHDLVREQVIHTIRYLYFSRFRAIVYQKSDADKLNHLICYSDSDYAQDPITRQSMNGFFVMFANAPVYWRSHYTPLVCKSSTEAELQAINFLTDELEWFHPLMKFISAYQGKVGCPELLVDNKSAIDTIVFGNFSPKAKPYAVRLKCLEERFNQRKFIIRHVGTENQLADLLTKPITIKVMDKLRHMLIQMLQIKGACRNL